MPIKTKTPNEFQKKNPKIKANIVSNRYAMGDVK
jgi:hypothetical protein